jgi:outer membrane lipoprotein-sorting protein
MKLWIAAAATVLWAASAHAQAAKPCEELKSEIAKKIEANGVKSYTLDIVAKDQDGDGKIVGTCDGGTKKIVYKRGDAGADGKKP